MRVISFCLHRKVYGEYPNNAKKLQSYALQEMYYVYIMDVH